MGLIERGMLFIYRFGVWFGFKRGILRQQLINEHRATDIIATYTYRDKNYPRNVYLDGFKQLLERL